MTCTTEAWLATFTRRWHANPDLCHTVDPVSSHSARMGVLALTLWPNVSGNLLAACLVHDLGERWVGDVPHTAKRDSELRATLDRLENAVLDNLGCLPHISEEDERRLRFLDRLDCYLWAKRHAPQIMNGEGWPEAHEWLLQEAASIGAVVDGLLVEAR